MISSEPLPATTQEAGNAQMRGQGLGQGRRTGLSVAESQRGSMRS